MGVNIETRVVRAELACDTAGCGSVLAMADPPDGHHAAHAELDRRAKWFDWSKWGSRSARYYCPDHGPKQTNHKMRRIF